MNTLTVAGFQSFEKQKADECWLELAAFMPDKYDHLHGISCDDVNDCQCRGICAHASQIAFINYGRCPI